MHLTRPPASRRRAGRSALHDQVALLGAHEQHICAHIRLHRINRGETDQPETRDSYSIDGQHPLELNRYGSVANNPVNAVEPSGLVRSVPPCYHRQSGMLLHRAAGCGLAYPRIASPRTRLFLPFALDSQERIQQPFGVRPEHKAPIQTFSSPVRHEDMIHSGDVFPEPDTAS